LNIQTEEREKKQQIKHTIPVIMRIVISLTNTHNTHIHYHNFDSERMSNECIDFTMIIVFFYFFILVSAITVWVSKTPSIFFNNIMFDETMNLVSAFERSKFNIPNSYQKHRVN